MNWTLASIGPVSFLIVAVIDDLCFKKFHNWIFLTLSVVGFASTLYFDLLTPIETFGGFVVGGLLMLPLVLMGATGAGDMKFMMSFGTLMGTLTLFEVFVYALFWGALIGLLQSLFSGRIKLLSQNLLGFFYKLKPTQTQKIPYTVAILFGWLTYVQFGGLL